MKAMAGGTSGGSPVSGAKRWRVFLLLLAGLETLAGAGMVVFLLSQMGSDPLGRSIAIGVAVVFGMFLLLGAMPALLLAWHGRFLYAAGGLAIGAPLILMIIWRGL